MSWFDLDLTFDLAIMTLTYKLFSGLYVRNSKVQEVGTLVGGCMCGTSYRDLDLTFDLAVVTLTYKSCSGYISETIRCRKLLLGRDIGWGL